MNEGCRTKNRFIWCGGVTLSGVEGKRLPPPHGFQILMTHHENANESRFAKLQTG